MFLAFRADASTEIGAGHIARCLNLADAFKGKGVKTCFFSRRLPGSLFSNIRKRGHDLFELAEGSNGWQVDATETLSVLSQAGVKPDAFIVDHYGLDWKWEKQVREQIGRVIVIDDVVNRTHDCDLLLNSGCAVDLEAAYRKLVPARARILVGPKYVLLGQSFIEAKRQSKVGTSLFVFFGNGDATGETVKVLSALANIKPSFETDVVIGSANPHSQAIESIAKNISGVQLHRNLPNLSETMARSQLALTAGGNSLYELLFLEVPSLVITTATNQLPTVSELSRQGYIQWLGDAEKVTEQRLEKELRDALEKPNTLPKKVLKTLDGLGTHRVVDEILSFQK